MSLLCVAMRVCTLVQNYMHHYAGENCTEEGSIRLAGSRSSQFREVEGYVEFCSNGVWGTVCRNGWGILDATVVCRELGHFTFGM